MVTISGFRIIEIDSREWDRSRTSWDSRLGNRLLVRFLVSVSLVLLLFSALGPGFDHHFAERTHHHSHAFIGHDGGHLDLEHQHQFDSLHAHHNPIAGAAVGGGPSGPFSSSPGVVYLTPVDALAQSHFPMALSTDQGPWIFSDLPPGLHEFALIVGNKIPENRNIQPLDKPPQL